MKGRRSYGWSGFTSRRQRMEDAADRDAQRASLHARNLNAQEARERAAATQAEAQEQHDTQGEKKNG
jgi:hypothetical protein